MTFLSRWFCSVLGLFALAAGVLIVVIAGDGFLGQQLFVFATFMFILDVGRDDGGAFGAGQKKGGVKK